MLHWWKRYHTRRCLAAFCHWKRVRSLMVERGKVLCSLFAHRHHAVLRSALSAWRYRAHRKTLSQREREHSESKELARQKWERIQIQWCAHWKANKQTKMCFGAWKLYVTKQRQYRLDLNRSERELRRAMTHRKRSLLNYHFTQWQSTTTDRAFQREQQKRAVRLRWIVYKRLALRHAMNRWVTLSQRQLRYTQAVSRSRRHTLRDRLRQWQTRARFLAKTRRLFRSISIYHKAHHHHYQRGCLGIALCKWRRITDRISEYTTRNTTREKTAASWHSRVQKRHLWRLFKRWRRTARVLSTERTLFEKAGKRHAAFFRRRRFIQGSFQQWRRSCEARRRVRSSVLRCLSLRIKAWKRLALRRWILSRRRQHSLCLRARSWANRVNQRRQGSLFRQWKGSVLADRRLRHLRSLFERRWARRTISVCMRVWKDVVIHKVRERNSNIRRGIERLFFHAEKRRQLMVALGWAQWKASVIDSVTRERKRCAISSARHRHIGAVASLLKKRTKERHLRAFMRVWLRVTLKKRRVHRATKRASSKRCHSLKWRCFHTWAVYACARRRTRARLWIYLNQASKLTERIALQRWTHYNRVSRFLEQKKRAQTKSSLERWKEGVLYAKKTRKTCARVSGVTRTKRMTRSFNLWMHRWRERVIRRVNITRGYKRLFALFHHRRSRAIASCLARWKASTLSAIECERSQRALVCAQDHHSHHLLSLFLIQVRQKRMRKAVRAWCVVVREVCEKREIISLRAAKMFWAHRARAKAFRWWGRRVLLVQNMRGRLQR